ncbi:hypothetical protein AHiyo4_29790 [Arthrobacter sp. Hiyo4]|nr:hypothetical protein AHiyo4_29790 [Arthrobacter sp. Hiyo4]
MPADPSTSTATRQRATAVSDFPTMLVGEMDAALLYRVSVPSAIRALPSASFSAPVASSVDPEASLVLPVASSEAPAASAWEPWSRPGLTDRPDRP